MELKSVIFDMDGVITDTAQVHFKAWKMIFDPFLEEYAELNHKTFQPFTLQDYLQYVDGMSRIDGVKHFLLSRNLLTSFDHPSKQDAEIISQIAESKNAVFLKILEDEGVRVFDSTVNLIAELKKNNLKTAVISSSRNCKDILSRANVLELFDAVVDGQELSEYNLKGKPAPDIFLEAAKRISSDPNETIIIEDALSGIIAGKAGKFGLVVGIDRQNKNYDQFKKEGADLIVKDLSEIKFSQLQQRLIQNNVLARGFSPILNKVHDKVLLLFFDYDGTLTPIVKRPEFAILSKEMKDMLYQLKQHCTVVIISGRELKDLEDKVAINGLYYAGNHGFEIIGPEHFATKFEVGHDYLEVIKRTYETIVPELSAVENCIIENKHYSLSVHYRLVDEQFVPFIEDVVKNIVAQNPMVSMHFGKKVFEIRPNLNWNKGKAVSYIMDIINEDSLDYFPVYIGDDVTDEDAFYSVRENGMGILVSEESKETHATYRIKNPGEVYHLLESLLAIAKLQPSLPHHEKNWSLTYTDYEPERETLREALTTLGNGYFATRGAGDFCHADKYHYPGTYFAGCYNRLKSIIAGEEIYNEDLVNAPNWLPILFKVNDNEWFDLTHYELLEYKQELNLRKGILNRHLHVRDREGRESQLHFERFVSMSNPHLACQRFTIIPLNWSDEITVQSGLDGSVINGGVARYHDLNSKHLEILKISSDKDNEISLVTRTSQSHIEIAYTASHFIFENYEPISADSEVKISSDSIYQFIRHGAKKNQAFTVEKRVILATNKDPASSDCLTDTQNILTYTHEENHQQLLDSHTQAWKNLWKRCDIKIIAQGEDQRILRLHIFHLLQTVSKNSLDLDIGVPARGLHGESYRGHIFWDEVFIMPFYTFYFPEMARALMMYRYRRLNMARHLAHKAGYHGAMYPWQSASNGDETTQSVHLNPRSNTWMPDFSHYQRHVNAAIVYNVWQYYLMTHDINFLSDYGAEMVIEIARFWASIANYNKAIDRYEIHHVVGPDEYHEKYPKSNSPGVNNNAYTNIMAVWSLERALEIIQLLDQSRALELMTLLHLKEDELELWQNITTKMKIPFHDDHIISQFEGYENLPEFSWEKYLEKYGNIERLDRILKAENDSPDNYKVSKQADVLMLFYLFSEEELSALFSKLGYSFDRNILIDNIHYYLNRTSHGSTLSKVVLASLYQYIGEDLALRYYQDVLNSDIMDVQGGTTAEGVHLGAMASCVNITLMCFAGVAIKNNQLSFSPKLPSDMDQIQFSLQFRQHWLQIKVAKHSMVIKLQAGSDQNLPVLVNDQLYYLLKDQPVQITY